jgi:hypothetical protein
MYRIQFIICVIVFFNSMLNNKRMVFFNVVALWFEDIWALYAIRLIKVERAVRIFQRDAQTSGHI